MSAATLEDETVDADAPAVSSPPKNVVFLSNREGLRLVLEPRMDQYNTRGSALPPTDGRTVVFTDNRLVVPLELKGKDKAAMFVCADGRKAPSSEIIEELENHRLCGDKVEGFWRHEEPTPAPTADEVQRIIDYAIGLDEAGLKRLIAEEEDGWCRPALVGQARTSLERVEASRRVLDEQQERKLAAARQEGIDSANAEHRAKTTPIKAAPKPSSGT